MFVNSVDVATLKEWILSNSVVVVDVREENEHVANNIPNSFLVPLDVVCMSKMPNFDGKNLVLYCHSGVRSLNACKKLIKENPNCNVYNLSGGIVAWNANSLK